MPDAFYLDTSVLIHAMLDNDRKAFTWFESTAAVTPLISSALLRLETIRVLRREGFPPEDAEPFLQRVSLLTIDGRILRIAASIPDHVKTLDSIHVASAMMADAKVIIATHDQTMQSVARNLSFEVIDPV